MLKNELYPIYWVNENFDNMYLYVHVYARVCMCVNVHGASNIVQIMLISFNSCSFSF